MVDILAALNRIERKMDSMNPAYAPAIASAFTPDSSSLAPTSTSQSQASLSSGSKGTKTESDFAFPQELQEGYQHLTVPHKIIFWPSIYFLLINSRISAASDLQHVLQEGTPWFIRQEMQSHQDELPTNFGLTSHATSSHSPGETHSRRVMFPDLTSERVRQYCEAYFDSFNVVYPILHAEGFLQDIMTPIMRDGFAETAIESVLALLVLALGQVAIDGVFEQPISRSGNSSSGFRGGSIDHPPGIELFNEARRRLGFVATSMTLENVQVMLLQATYYETCARHLDYWRSTTMASVAVHVLVRCGNIDWSTAYGDLVKRAYWTCVLGEDLYHLDLDLPITGVQDYEEEVPNPQFRAEQHQTPGPLSADDRSHFQYHFLAMIALRRVISRISASIHKGMS